MNSSDRFYRALVTLLGGAAAGTGGVAVAQDATPPPAPTEDARPTAGALQLAEVVDGYGVQAAHEHIEGCEDGDCSIQGFPADIAALDPVASTTFEKPGCMVLVIAAARSPVTSW